MKLVSVEFSQITFLTTIVAPRGNLYLPEVVAGAQERYEFVEVPKTLAAMRDPNGALFQMGKYRDFVIDQLKVYTDGILVQSKAPIEDVETFLDDLLSWLDETFEAKVSEFASSQKMYDSHLVVRLKVDLQRHLKMLDRICQILSSHLDSYGIASPAFIPTGLRCHADMHNETGLKPSAFLIERREALPYESNLYFSTAPLKTADHLNLLTEAERLLS